MRRGRGWKGWHDASIFWRQRTLSLYRENGSRQKLEELILLKAETWGRKWKKYFSPSSKVRHRVREWANHPPQEEQALVRTRYSAGSSQMYMGMCIPHPLTAPPPQQTQPGAADARGSQQNVYECVHPQQNEGNS